MFKTILFLTLLTYSLSVAGAYISCATPVSGCGSSMCMEGSAAAELCLWCTGSKVLSAVPLSTDAVNSCTTANTATQCAWAGNNAVASQCTVCNAGYGLALDGNCYACGAGCDACATYQDSTSAYDKVWCSVAKSAFFLDAATGTSTACTAGCMTCTSATACTACTSAAMFISSGGCTACTASANCATCSSASTCLTCATAGHVVDSATGSCVAGSGSYQSILSILSLAVLGLFVFKF